MSHVPEVADDHEQCPSQERDPLTRVVQGQGESLQTLTEMRSPCPQTQRQVAGGMSPLDTSHNVSPTDPIHPQAPVGGRSQ